MLPRANLSPLFLTLTVAVLSLALGALSVYAWPWLFAWVVLVGVVVWQHLREEPSDPIQEQLTPTDTPIPPPPKTMPARFRPLAEFPSLDSSSMRVLLLEDNPTNPFPLAGLLTDAGHRVTAVKTSHEALLSLDRAPFDLVLLDLRSKQLDCVRCTRLLRQQEKASGRRVPVVAVTASVTPGERQRCLEAGVDAYQIAPANSREVTELLDKLTPTEKCPAEAPEWMSSLLEMGFDSDGLVDLTQAFIDSVPGRLEELRTAVVAGDCDEVARSAHSLKGSLGVFSARAASEATVAMHALAHERRSGDFVTALAKLEAELGPLLESMRKWVRLCGSPK